MYKFLDDKIAWFRNYRDLKLAGPAKFLIRMKVNANLMTTLSLLAGLSAAYFLFVDYIFFIISAFFHLLFDTFDGVIARWTSTSRLGQNFDFISDNLAVLLFIIKVGIYLGDIYPYLIAILFLLENIIYILSEYKNYYLNIRTTSLAILAVASYPSAANISYIILTISYLIAGILIVYTLARQLQWLITRIDRR